MKNFVIATILILLPLSVYANSEFISVDLPSLKKAALDAALIKNPQIEKNDLNFKSEILTLQCRQENRSTPNETICTGRFSFKIKSSYDSIITRLTNDMCQEKYTENFIHIDINSVGLISAGPPLQLSGTKTSKCKN